jgi:hypothetical protein
VPRPEPQKEPKKKVSEFYVSGQEYITSDDDLRKAVDSTIDATRKTLDTIARIFWDKNTQKSHISEDLIYRLEPIWDDEVAPVLSREFGRNTSLSVIFYKGEYSDEILMEIWDSRHVNTKSSQIFKIRGVPTSEVRYFARYRDQAPVLNLNHWI